MYAQKMKRTHSFLPKCVLGTQENWVWPSLPKNLCDHNGMPFEPPFCHSSGHVYTKEFIRFVQPSTMAEVVLMVKIQGVQYLFFPFF